jgi:hypothetical protein
MITTDQIEAIRFAIRQTYNPTVIDELNDCLDELLETVDADCIASDGSCTRSEPEVDTQEPAPETTRSAGNVEPPWAKRERELLSQGYHSWASRHLAMTEWQTEQDHLDDQ